MSAKNPIPGNTPWKRGQSGNANGRPPKLLSALTRSLREAGYERVGPATMLETVELMIGLPADELMKMVEDKEAPIAQKIIATHLLAKSDRLRLLLDLLDRAHGKASLSKDVLPPPETPNDRDPTVIELPGGVRLEL